MFGSVRYRKRGKRVSKSPIVYLVQLVLGEKEMKEERRKQIKRTWSVTAYGRLGCIIWTEFVKLD